MLTHSPISIEINTRRWIFPEVITAKEMRMRSRDPSTTSRTRRKIGFRDDPGAKMFDMNEST